MHGTGFSHGINAIPLDIVPLRLSYRLLFDTDFILPLVLAFTVQKYIGMVELRFSAPEY
jgi:hypothetical protein